MKFQTELTVDKIVAAVGKPLQITAGIPDNARLLEFINSRKGKAMEATFRDIQGDLLEDDDAIMGLEDLRLPAGTVLEIPAEDLGVEISNSIEGGLTLPGGETTLREIKGFPYLAIGIEGGPPVMIPFTVFFTWIMEEHTKLLELMESVDKKSQEDLPLENEASFGDGQDPGTGEVIEHDVEPEATFIVQVDKGTFLVKVDLDAETVDTTPDRLQASSWPSMEEAANALVQARKFYVFPDAGILDTTFIREAVEEGTDPDVDSSCGPDELEQAVPGEQEEEADTPPPELYDPATYPGLTVANAEEIEGMDIETMLRLNRTAQPGHPMFSGGRGKFFLEVLAKKRDADPEAYTAASKSIGHEG